MQKTTIVIPEELHERLKAIARERRQSMAAVIRDELESATQRRQPRPKAVGIISSGHRDTAQTAGDWKFEPRTWRS